MVRDREASGWFCCVKELPCAMGYMLTNFNAAYMYPVPRQAGCQRDFSFEAEHQSATEASCRGVKRAHMQDEWKD
jgi:hypothetical protein